jgi:hypothetical protein
MRICSDSLSDLLGLLERFEPKVLVLRTREDKSLLLTL